jgi:hypothetical protein
LTGQLPMHGLDDVAALPHATQGRLEIAREPPDAGFGLTGKTQAFERSQPPHAQYMALPIALWRVRQRQHPAPCVAEDRPVEPGEPLLVDLAFELADRVELGLRPKLPRKEIACPLPHAVGNVVAGDHEVLAAFVLAAEYDMGMWMPRVEMIHGHPVELGAEILLHLPHQIADEGLEIGELGAVLGRDNEAELVAILSAALHEVLPVRLVGRRIVNPARLPSRRDTVALDVA